MKKGRGAAVIMTALGAVAFAAGCDGSGGEVLPGVEALVFVKRAFVTADGRTHDVAGGSGQVIDYERYTPGSGEDVGGVFVLRPPTPDGELTNLTAAYEAVDVGGIDLSFDAQQVVFSMRHAETESYDIYIANLDGSGVRQLTFGTENDLFPIFLPGDRIAFTTTSPVTFMGTRHDEYERGRAPQLATISVDGGDADRRLISENLSHVVLPFLLSDGTVGFSNWEHLGDVNDVKLRRMNPDGTNIQMIAGQFNKPFNSIVQAQEISPGQFVGIGTSRSGSIQAGAIIHIDARSQTSTEPDLYIDVQQARFTNLTPEVPTSAEQPASGAGRYRFPRPLGDDYIVSWANGDVNERNELANTAPNFGIYLWDPESGQRTLVYDDPNMWDQYAIPVRTRTEPRAIPSTLDPNLDPTTPAELGSIDVTQTSLNETVDGAQFDGTPLGEALAQATRVRIIEGFSSEIGAVRMFGLTMHEGAAIMGETPVYADGSWRAQVPAYVPYHLQPIDRFGLAIRNQLLWIQAMPGETRTCGGCHESRSETVIPRIGTAPIAQQNVDTTTYRPVAERMELPWFGATSGDNIQDLFNAACVDCHSGAGNVYGDRSYMVTVETEAGGMQTYTIPYLDLGETPITVEYDNDVVTYPVSYVSLLYPSAMMGDSVVMGDMAPMWVIPGDARGSRLVEAVNIAAEGNDAELAYDRPLHPEDVGVNLTREQRLSLIRMADLGGQYYSRRNVPGGFAYEDAPEYTSP